VIDTSFLVDDKEKARRNREMVANAQNIKRYTHGGGIGDCDWLLAKVNVEYTNSEIFFNRVLSLSGYDYLMEGGELDAESKGSNSTPKPRT
jgi:hypothetical protein